MDVRFLGGAEQVGSLGMLMETWGVKLLFDYGLTPTSPPGYPLPAPHVDRVFLTHAHVDHSGMIPWMCGHRNSIVHTLPPTADVSLLLAKDSNKICGYEGYPQPYDEHDIHQTEANFRTLRYGQEKWVGDVEIVPHPAGHIPGAAMYEVRCEEVALFTGDINTTETGLVGKAEPVRCHTLFLESTYAGRRHETRAKVEHDFLAKIEEVVDGGGRVVIPAFAVGRTQEVLLLLRNSGYEIWLDGMGRAITGMYLDHGDYVRDHKKLSKARGQVQVVRHPRSRNAALKGDVIVTTSGMLEGGPVLHYLKDILGDEKSAVMLTGYQVEGTNGRMLLDEGVIEIDGEKRRPQCELCFADLSAHSDHDQLIRFAKDCEPERIVLMHGDNREAMEEELAEEFEVLTPMKGEVVRL